MNDDIFSSNYLRSLAVMGGTFDPIHYGHLVTAETVRQEFNVDKVVFVPSGDPPHKSSSTVNDKEHRYLMTVASTLSNPYFAVSRIEIERDGYSYSVDTISRIRQLCPSEMPVYFIVGADALMEMNTWKNPEELFSICRFVAVTRPGFNKETASRKVEFLRGKYGAKINLIDVPSYNLSSTDIRQRVQNNESIRYMVPEEVNLYIQKNGLYRDEVNLSSIDYGAITAYLKDTLSEKRYEHTMNTADMAVRLSKFYGVNEDKAYVASLLHDIAKEIPADEKLVLCSEYGIELDELTKETPDLAHGAIGAKMAHSLFGINDKDILNAIHYHTTGRAKMSTLERLVLLADSIDNGREYDADASRIRKLADKSLNKAVISALIDKIQYTEKKKHKIHPATFEALKFLEQDS
ncbi:MAG: nicotinate-nucleotide adenylyltransferase [Clostridiales bacterium]|jgi:nicotinate-nucleotide adenylyltransferase|nr:nicotinate-nucleotide adenylyltransferase [Clostridiales bacterium]